MQRKMPAGSGAIDPVGRFNAVIQTFRISIAVLLCTSVAQAPVRFFLRHAPKVLLQKPKDRM